MIDGLRELLRAATPGPWQLGRGEEGDTHFIAQNGWGGGGPNYYADAAYPQDEADGQLIVALRNEAEGLLDAHDRMAGALRDVLATVPGGWQKDAFAKARAALEVSK